MNARAQFLHPPPEGKLVPEDLRCRVESANRAMEQAFPTGTQGEERDHLLRTEALYSAAIENENDPERIAQHHRALEEFLAKPLTPDSLLELHHSMMAGQSHAEPGRYRSVQVVIGDHRPPGPALVPSLMDELFTFLREHGNNRVARATWAHVEFESIHPFADGNGRAGRALLLHVLGAPIPISRFIFSTRPTYYHLFRKSDWHSWLEWMAGGVAEESQRYGESTNQETG